MTYTPEQQQLAQKVLDHIELHPEQHEQDVWLGSNACGTVACIAGWTVLLAEVADIVEEGKWHEEDDLYCHYFQFKDESTRVDPSTAAQDLLGLSDTEAFRLFMLKSEGTAKEALRYIANGKDIDWEKISTEHSTMTIVD